MLDWAVEAAANAAAQFGVSVLYKPQAGTGDLSILAIVGSQHSHNDDRGSEGLFLVRHQTFNFSLSDLPTQGPTIMDTIQDSKGDLWTIEDMDETTYNGRFLVHAHREDKITRFRRNA